MGNHSQASRVRREHDVDALSVQGFDTLRGADPRALFFDATAVHQLCFEHERMQEQHADERAQWALNEAMLKALVVECQLTIVGLKQSVADSVARLQEAL